MIFLLNHFRFFINFYYLLTNILLDLLEAGLLLLMEYFKVIFKIFIYLSFIGELLKVIINNT